MIDVKVLREASDMLKGSASWVIFTHRKADGDAVGSATALCQAGIDAGKNISWYSPDAKLPETYKFLPCYDFHVTAEKYGFGDNALSVFLDCANETRSVEGFSAGINALNIDHHEDNTLFGRVNCVDGRASSTCEVLYQVFRAGEWDITASIARSLYTGIFTDTGGFMFSNTSPLTHRILAELIEHGAEPNKLTDKITQNKTPESLLAWGRAFSRVRTFGPEKIFALSWLKADDFAETGADMTDTEGLPGMLMSLRGVKLIAMLTENANGEARVSFRSRDGSPFGAGEIARQLGGGGHERAAGCTVKGTLRECTEQVEALIMQKYHECLSSGE